jgi:Domain of unknown function (DUF4399)
MIGQSLAKTSKPQLYLTQLRPDLSWRQNLWNQNPSAADPCDRRGRDPLRAERPYANAVGSYAAGSSAVDASAVDVTAHRLYKKTMLRRQQPVRSPTLIRANSPIPHAAAFAAACAALCLLAATPAFSQAKPDPKTASPQGALVYFIDVKDGDTLPPKSIIHFGLRGMGLAPAGVARDNSGHHHLLIDTELPPLDTAIPADFNHLHFGAGQTEAEVNLTPGEHTLQLLLGDQNHIPHAPTVMSPRIKVRVVEAGAPQPSASAASSSSGAPKRHASAPKAKVYFVYPTDGATISRTPTIRFGLIGMGVAPAGVEKANTGHHHLMVDAPLPPLDQPIPTDFNHLHFGAGQTEAQVTLPLGQHTLQLLLADDNHVPHDPPLFSTPIKVTVTASGRKPTHRRHRYRRPRFL